MASFKRKFMKGSPSFVFLSSFGLFLLAIAYVIAGGFIIGSLGPQSEFNRQILAIAAFVLGFIIVVFLIPKFTSKEIDFERLDFSGINSVEITKGAVLNFYYIGFGLKKKDGSREDYSVMYSESAFRAGTKVILYYTPNTRQSMITPLELGSFVELFKAKKVKVEISKELMEEIEHGTY